MGRCSSKEQRIEGKLVAETTAFISVIVPTFNRPQIAQCLAALTAQDYPKTSYEVIVVDDGTTQENRIPLEIAVTNARESGVTIKLLHQKNAGPAIARNNGATRASGSLLAFTDDDCAPTPDWLSALSRAFAAFPNDGFGGYTINTLIQNVYSETSQLLIDYLYDYFNQSSAHFFASNNMAFPTALFRKIGGFHTGFPFAAAEDREICRRWLENGYRLRYIPDAVVQHSHALSFARFFRQQFTYGRGAFYYHHLPTTNTNRSPTMEPFSFYSNMIRYPFQAQSRSSSPGPWGKALRLTTLIGLSQIANAAGYYREKSVVGTKKVEK